MTPVAVFVRQRESWWQHEHRARAVPALLSCELRSRHRPVLTVARSACGDRRPGVGRFKICPAAQPLPRARPSTVATCITMGDAARPNYRMCDPRGWTTCVTSPRSRGLAPLMNAPVQPQDACVALARRRFESHRLQGSQVRHRRRKREGSLSQQSPQNRRRAAIAAASWTR